MDEKKHHLEHHKQIHMPKHPHADKYGNIYQHRLEVEKSIERYLEPTEIIHHHFLWNGDVLYVICANAKEHSETHTMEESFRFTGYYDWRKCQFCKQYSPVSDPNLSILNHATYHKSCATAYAKKRKIEKEKANKIKVKTDKEIKHILKTRVQAWR